MKASSHLSGQGIPKPCRLLDPNEVAAMLGVKPATLAEWRCKRRNALPYLRIGSRIKYRADDVQLFLDTVRVNPVELD